MSQVLNGYDGDFSERCRLDQSCYSPPSLKDRMTLDDKRILILGGTSGIGLAVANAAANEGASVVVVSSRQAKVQAALQNLPKSAQGHVVDLADEKAVELLFSSIQPFDHLVFTAGDSVWQRPIGETDFSDAQKFFGVRY